jgi:hypothetical protein
LDDRMVKMECDISGGKCHQEVLVVRQVNKIERLGRADNLGGQEGRKPL